MVASPIGAFTALYSQFQQAIGREPIGVFELLDTPPEMQDAPDALPLPAIEGTVCF